MKTTKIQYRRSSASTGGFSNFPLRPGVEKEAGFTLIEVMAALLILAIGAVALLELQLASMRASDRAARQSQAVLFASRKMAETLASSSTVPGTSQGATDEDTAGGPLNWTVTVVDLSGSEIEGASINGLQSVTVDVTWPEGDLERKVELVNYLSQKSGNVQTVK